MKDYDGPSFLRSNASKDGHRKKNSQVVPPRRRFFHPTVVPPSMASQTVAEPNYKLLIQELFKPLDKYLFFSQHDDVPLVDLTHGLSAEVLQMAELENEAEDKLQASPSEVEMQAAVKPEAVTEIPSAENEAEPKLEPEMMPQPVSHTEEAKVEPMLKAAPEVELKPNAAVNQNKTDIKHPWKVEAQVQQTLPESAETDIKGESQKFPLISPEKLPVSAEPDVLPTAQPLAPAKSYQFPSLELLDHKHEKNQKQSDDWAQKQAKVLDETLKSFKVGAHVVHWTIGPTVTQFELVLDRGVKVNKITNLNDDLKLALAAKDIRIEAPIPGRSTVGIEIPNQKARQVLLAEVLESKAFQEASSPLTTALGVDLFGQPRVFDIAKMPHGLIAGATGSGKSVFINSLLVSILYKAKPSEVKLLLIDPKAVELAPYQGIAHLLAPVISDAKQATEALKWAVDEMEDRYQKMAQLGARNLAGYNDKVVKKGHPADKLPYILIVIDELADLMMASSSEVQEYIARITQKARAAGIHLIVATQRPSVDVVTGLIKNNIPTRLAFMVASSTDSRTILDASGAERLLGKGDMLFLASGASQPVRLQGTYIDDEIDDICDFIRQQAQPSYAFDPEKLKKKAVILEKEDELMPRVLDYIVNEDTISTSKLQRVFSIGYNRAASMIDTLEARGYISKAHGAKPRKVNLTQEALNNMRF